MFKRQVVGCIAAMLALSMMPRAALADEELNAEFRVKAGLGEIQRVRELLKQGVDVNCRAPSTGTVPAGTTALMLAAARDHLDVVKLLVANGANVNQADEGGGTALIYAVWKGHKDVVAHLLEKGANVHAKTRDGRTPLSVASQFGRTEIESMLKAAADKKQPAGAHAEQKAQDYPVMCQIGVDVVTTRDGRTETNRVAVYGVQGMPFPAATLTVDRRAQMPKTTIRIVSAEGHMLTPSTERGSETLVNYGLATDGKTGMSFFTRAINVTWEFVEAGISFTAQDSTYRTTRAGATISFTEDGVKMDGIEKIEKASATAAPPHTPKAGRAGAPTAQEPKSAPQEDSSPLGDLLRGIVGPLEFVVRSLPYVFRMGSQSSQASGAIDQIWDHTWGKGTGFYKVGFAAGIVGILLIIGGIGSQAKKR